jgi:hypothetical protein
MDPVDEWGLERQAVEMVRNLASWAEAAAKARDEQFSLGTTD